jgi:hypothetical protein
MGEIVSTYEVYEKNGAVRWMSCVNLHIRASKN